MLLFRRENEKEFFISDFSKSMLTSARTKLNRRYFWLPLYSASTWPCITCKRGCQDRDAAHQRSASERSRSTLLGHSVMRSVDSTRAALSKSRAVTSISPANVVLAEGSRLINTQRQYFSILSSRQAGYKLIMATSIVAGNSRALNWSNLDRFIKKVQTFLFWHLKVQVY